MLESCAVLRRNVPTGLLRPCALLATCWPSGRSVALFLASSLSRSPSRFSHRDGSAEGLEQARLGLLVL